ncbi:hypothetical protein B6V72_09940 [Thioclava sp. F34-6]|nr:hypothetical protein B6V72_09940 [Thioclava sp. F34-6]
MAALPELPGLVGRPADADLPAAPDLPPAWPLPSPLPPPWPPPLPPPFPPPLPFLANAASAPVKWLVATGATTKLAATRATIEVFLRRMRPSSFCCSRHVFSTNTVESGQKSGGLCKMRKASPKAPPGCA